MRKKKSIVELLEKDEPGLVVENNEIAPVLVPVEEIVDKKEDVKERKYKLIIFRRGRTKKVLFEGL